MSPDAATDICRVTVVGPRKGVDLALPGDVPFAQLFPGIARFAGLDEAAMDGAQSLQSGRSRPCPLTA